MGSMILPLLLSLTAVDGDTIRLGNERIRLLAIDAPETHPCRKGRVCVPGDGQASKRNLERVLIAPVTVKRDGCDRYGRSLANVYSRGENVACAQLQAGQAVYVAKWDRGGVVARECR